MYFRYTLISIKLCLRSFQSFFKVIWWGNKNPPIIPRHKTGQINLTAIYLERKVICAPAPYLKKKVTIIEDFPHPGPNVPNVHAPRTTPSGIQKGHTGVCLI